MITTMLRTGTGAWRRWTLLDGARVRTATATTTNRTTWFSECSGVSRAFSSHSSPHTQTASDQNANAKNGKAEEEEKKIHPQPFVRVKFSAGEWDENRKDPFFRPKPHARTNLISAEDYANRPPVGFDNEFNTYQDAMITLTWMDEKTCKAIYETYTSAMVISQQQHGVTSHEYVVRLIAEKFKITPVRAAGIVQLQHNEEQMRQHHPELLCHEEAKYAEETIMQNIRDAYKSEGTDPPGTSYGSSSIPFMEEVVGMHGKGEPDETSMEWANADDMYDMTQKLVQANVRDQTRAQVMIDNHLYRVDKDENQEFVKTNASCQRLLRSKEKVDKALKAQQDARPTTTIPFPETNGRGEKRDRWKYVAQIVNTRDLKRKQHKWGHKKVPSTSYFNNTLGNTLVEHNGELRVATLAEGKQTAWKPTRLRSNEYVFEGVKKAWLERTLQGKTDVWGKAAKTRASDSIAEATDAKEAEAQVENAFETSPSEDTTGTATDESIVAAASETMTFETAETDVDNLVENDPTHGAAVTDEVNADLEGDDDFAAKPETEVDTEVDDSFDEPPIDK